MNLKVIDLYFYLSYSIYRFFFIDLRSKQHDLLGCTSCPTSHKPTASCYEISLSESDSDTDDSAVNTDKGQSSRSRSRPMKSRGCRKGPGSHRRGQRIRGRSTARLVRGASRRRGHACSRNRVQVRSVSDSQLLLEGPWKKEESNSLNFPYQGGEPGPTRSLDTSTSLVDIFNRFLLMMCGSCLLQKPINMLPVVGD